MAEKKSSIWTPANIVTSIRVVFVPIWLVAAEICGSGEGKAFSGAALFVALFYMVLSLTDKLDGYRARSRNEVTTFGKFLLEQGAVSAWVLLIIVAREFLVSGLRMVVASEGTVIAASNLGKWKTATTMVSISGLLLVRALPVGPLYTVLLGISNVLLIIAVVLTAWSGIDYFMKSWRYIADAD